LKLSTDGPNCEQLPKPFALNGDAATKTAIRDDLPPARLSNFFHFYRFAGRRGNMRGHELLTHKLQEFQFRVFH